jgi:transposase
MPGKNFQLTPLESRKQLLLVESELNRAQLLNELRDFKNEIHQLEDQMQAIGSLASSAATLANTFSAIGNAFTHRNGEEGKSKSWISTLWNGARTGVSLWSALRSHSK